MGNGEKKTGEAGALLLVGPTGSGKSPMGDLLAREGVFGRTAYHFDFGSELRAAVSGKCGDWLSPADLAVIAWSLDTGALLEREHFGIVQRVLRAFMARHRIGHADCVVMNGMPRQPDQLEAVEGLVRIRLAVCLECTAEVVFERIRLNTGGDRAGRADDTPAAVAARLETFRGRTLPLLDVLAANGVRIERVPVGVATTAATLRNELQTRVPAAAWAAMNG